MHYKIQTIKRYPRKYSIIHKTVDYNGGELSVNEPEKVLDFVQKHVGAIYDINKDFLKVYKDDNMNVIVDYGSMDAYIKLSPKISK